MTDWTAYEQRYTAHRERMRDFVSEVAAAFDAELWEDDVEDYGFHANISRAGGESLDLSLTIWDSGEADDGIYGQHGNFMLSAVEEGGRVIISFAPYNYSSRVWVDYSEDEEWEARLVELEESAESVVRRLEEWRKR